MVVGHDQQMTPVEFGVSRSKVIRGGHTCFTNISCYCLKLFIQAFYQLLNSVLLGRIGQGHCDLFIGQDSNIFVKCRVKSCQITNSNSFVLKYWSLLFIYIMYSDQTNTKYFSVTLSILGKSVIKMRISVGQPTVYKAWSDCTDVQDGLTIDWQQRVNPYPAGTESEQSLPPVQSQGRLHICPV